MPRSFALIPAAGNSVRMGQPKLLMPLQGRPLILHTLAAWRASQVVRVIVVVRPDDAALADMVRSTGAEVAVPTAPPPDMKASLICGLAHVQACYNPAPSDCWLVAPADMPGLLSTIINRLIEHVAATPETVLMPTIAGRRGHPVLLPWSLAGEMQLLAENEGLSDLIERHPSQLIPCDDLASTTRNPFADVDTAADLTAFANPKPPRAN